MLVSWNYFSVYAILVKHFFYFYFLLLILLLPSIPLSPPPKNCHYHHCLSSLLSCHHHDIGHICYHTKGKISSYSRQNWWSNEQLNHSTQNYSYLITTFWILDVHSWPLKSDLWVFSFYQNNILSFWIFITFL